MRHPAAAAMNAFRDSHPELYATKPAAEQIAQPKPVAVPVRWQDQPATLRQISYLVSLGVVVEKGITKGRASELIDAAKGDNLSAFGGVEAEGPQSIGVVD